MKLKDYIEHHKDRWDDQEFDENLVWGRIEQNLNTPGGKILSFSFLRRAAAIALVLLSAIVLYEYGYQNGKSQGSGEDIAELQAIESYYGSKYQTLKSSLEHSRDYDRSTKKAFFQTMEVLEDENIKLKDRLSRNIKDEQVMMALVENYKAQIRALEDFLAKQQIHKNQKTNDSEYLSL